MTERYEEFDIEHGASIEVTADVLVMCTGRS